MSIRTGFHVYCIIAHDQPERVARLCRMLDRRGNRLYVFVDCSRPIEAFRSAIAEAQIDAEIKVTATRSVPRWGSYDQVEAMMDAWAMAYADCDFDYLHVLSGADLPIKPQRRIHEFCASLPEATQLIDIFDDDADSSDAVRKATARFILPQALRLTRIPMLNRLTHYAVNMFPAWLQRHLGLGINGDIKIRKGSALMSLTRECVGYLLGRREWIERRFRLTLCPDELFVPTALVGSRFRLWSGGSMRLVDWTRGCPYVWRLSDYEELKQSDALFARKFDPEVDSRIIDRIEKDIAESEE